jgi:protein-disulfide isomerase
LPQLRILAGLLLVGLAVAYKAQSVPPAAPDPAINRRIEVQVRSQYEMPADVVISIGARSPSQFTGYETLPVTVTHGARSQVIDFLISADSTKLIHLETFDLTKDPADAIPITGRPIRGNPAAKVTLINFDDLECPFCARMHQELFPATLAHYKDMVRIVYKDDPLTDLHPWAMHAAVDANCLAVQNGDIYWKYVDYLHSHGQEITGEGKDPAKSFAALDRIAREEATLGKLDSVRLEACLTKQDEAQVRASAKEADDLAIDGTPAVFVNGERVNGGAVPEDQLWLVIDRALRDAGQQPPPQPPPPPSAGANSSAAPSTGGPSPEAASPGAPPTGTGNPAK